MIVKYEMKERLRLVYKHMRAIWVWRDSRVAIKLKG